MKRWVFNIAAILSLLLMLATVGLWVDGYLNYRVLGYELSTGYVAGVSVAGQFGLCLHHEEQPRGEGWYSHNWAMQKSNLKKYSSQYSLGFGGAWDQDTGFGRYYIAVSPHWFLTLIFTTLPAIWLYKWNKRRKLGPNACPGCGYDLTGNESGVCPECGGKIAIVADNRV